MKRIVPLLMILVLLLSGCKRAPEPSVPAVEPHVPAPDMTDITFDASYLRIHPFGDDFGDYPFISLMTDPELFPVSIEREDGYNEATQKYDDAFYQSKQLIYCLIEETSGSIEHEVTRVCRSDDGAVEMYVETSSPENCTDDMAWWCLFVEVDKTDITTLTLCIDGEVVTPHANAVDFDVQYVEAGTDHLKSTVIRSVEELEAYKQAAQFDVDYDSNLGDDSFVSFNAATQKYDDEFFASKQLVLSRLNSPNLGQRHRVEWVSYANGMLGVHITLLRSYVADEAEANWHIITEVDASLDIQNVDIFINGENHTGTPATVECNAFYAGMSIDLPEGWSYSKQEWSEEDDSFGIWFWPTDESEGKLYFECTGFLGLCGTGLETEQIHIGGYEAVRYMYDGNKLFDIIGIDTQGMNFVIWNRSTWLGEYYDEVMEILDSVTVKVPSMSKEQALKIAKSICTIDYIYENTSYNFKTDCWGFT